MWLDYFAKVIDHLEIMWEKAEPTTQAAIELRMKEFYKTAQTFQNKINIYSVCKAMSELWLTDVTPT